MKLWILSSSLTASLLILSGCTGAKPSPKENAVIDTSLPTVSLTKNGTIVDMNSVAFEYKPIQNPKVDGVYVYKKSPATEGKDSTLEYYATVNSRYKTHYLDRDVKPDTKYSYAFATFHDGKQSKLSKEITLNTLPVLQSVSWIHSITGMPRTAKIIWRPHENEKVKSYIIERKTLDDDAWEKIATLRGRLNAEFVDKRLHDNYVYMYRVRVVTYDGIVSTPSQIVKVVTKALPHKVNNIRTTNNLPKSIKIDWDKSTDKDFKRYYVYRSSEIDGTYKLIAKLYNNTFVDKGITEDGKSYFYRVSVVDKDGLESEHELNSIHGMSLPRPEAPAVLEAKLIGTSIKLTWKKLDPRTKSYVVRKTVKKGWFKEEQEDFDGILEEKFIDKNIEPDSEYRYQVYAVDKYLILSKPSIEVKIVTPESTQIESAPKQKAVVQKVSTTAVDEKTSQVITSSDDLDLSGL